MTSKYIFLDVDGTLVSYENILPDSAVEAIHQAQANGHKVFTVTGRSKAEMYKEILDIGFDGYVGGNGNYIEVDGEIIYHKHLTGEETRRIVDWLLERNLEFYLEANSGLYGSSGFRERGRQTVQDYVAYKGNRNPHDVSVESASLKCYLIKIFTVMILTRFPLFWNHTKITLMPKRLFLIIKWELGVVAANMPSLVM